MNVYHKELAAGRWKEFPLALQMAHVGSEVERALKWHEAGDASRARPAYERALELLDLTSKYAHRSSQIRELRRAREALADYFDGDNEIGSSPADWQQYFDAFTYAVRKNC
jgi:hypothetical protein